MVGEGGGNEVARSVFRGNYEHCPAEISNLTPMGFLFLYFTLRILCVFALSETSFTADMQAPAICKTGM